MSFLYFKIKKIMAKKPKIQLPQSTAGLVRYYEEEDTKFKFDPEQIVAISIALIVLVVLLGMAI